MKGGDTAPWVATKCRKHELNPNMVRRWVKRAAENGGKLPGKNKGVATHVTPEKLRALNAERDELASENEKMKKAPGEQALEIAVLRDRIKKGNPPSLPQTIAFFLRMLTHSQDFIEQELTSACL